MADPDRCPRCGEANDCAVAAGGTRCWCFTLPPAANRPAAAAAATPATAAATAGAAGAGTCLCRRCLTSVSDAHPVVMTRTDIEHQP